MSRCTEVRWTPLAAKKRNRVATSAMVTPKELMITYFQAASSDRGLPSSPTKTTLASVLVSMRTHSSPKLPVMNTASIPDANSEKKPKYRRTWNLLSSPLASSAARYAAEPKLASTTMKDTTRVKYAPIAST